MTRELVQQITQYVTHLVGAARHDTVWLRDRGLLAARLQLFLILIFSFSIRVLAAFRIVVLIFLYVYKDNNWRFDTINTRTLLLRVDLRENILVPFISSKFFGPAFS
jgi:hypothetical protein